MKEAVGLKWLNVDNELYVHLHSLANINVLRVCDLKLFLQIKHYISVRVHNLGILGKHKLDVKVG